MIISRRLSRASNSLITNWPMIINKRQRPYKTKAKKRTRMMETEVVSSNMRLISKLRNFYQMSLILG